MENSENVMTTEMIERAKITLLDAMIVGAGGFRVKHGMIAPYTHGYTVKHDMFSKCYCDPVTCSSNWMKELPERLFNYLTKQEGWTDYGRFEKLAEETKIAWNNLPTDYDPRTYSETDSIRRHVANGYETDGFYNIVKGNCFGTYSTCTTGNQNDLAKELIVLKGFCPDVYSFNHELSKETLEEVYKRHGIDSDLSDMEAWAKRNPTRCGSNKSYYISRKS